jgi:hypothetical protein
MLAHGMSECGRNGGLRRAALRHLRHLQRLRPGADAGELRRDRRQGAAPAAAAAWRQRLRVGQPPGHGLYDLLFAEAWPVTVNPARFRSEEARMQVMARIAGILGDLEMAIRRELGADQIPPKTRPSSGNAG